MWNNIKINSNLIQGKTENAVLIKIPKEDWLFWIPAKLVRLSGKNNYLCSIGINDSFEYSLFKNGKGQYNQFDKIAEKKVTGSEFKYMLGFED